MWKENRQPKDRENVLLWCNAISWCETDGPVPHEIRNCSTNYPIEQNLTKQLNETKCESKPIG